MEQVSISTPGRGLHNITTEIASAVARTGLSSGVATVFIQHTSASLIIQENADPAVLSDLQNWMDQHVPERSELYDHNEEGPDDMPAHIKSALTATHLSIPVVDGKLALGVWQGVFLWEHRRRGSSRSVLVHMQ